MRYPGITEYEIRWRDWGWIYARVEKILRDLRLEKRWQMEATLLSMSAAMNGKDAFEQWQHAYNALFTDADRREQFLRETAEQEARIAEANQRKVDALIASLKESGKLEAFLQGGVA